MNNGVRHTRLLSLLVFPLLWASCATEVRFQVEHPPLVDLRGVDTITVIPLEWNTAAYPYLTNAVTRALSTGIRSVIFSQTADLDALNPAAALRQSGRAGELALFAAREAETADITLARVTRVLIHCYLPRGSQPCHVYRNGAEVLRPDRVP